MKRKPRFGSWITIGHPALVEIMAACGFEWLAVDLEHGTADMSHCLSLIQAIKGQGVVPMARLPYNDTIWIRRSLDMGFMGLIIPLVNSGKEAANAVKVAKYPPLGERGLGYAPANMYGLNYDEYVSQANRDIEIICQVETAASVENIEDILSVEGVDGILLGWNDLSGSLGVLGEFDHPLMIRACKNVLTACKENNKIAGILVIQPNVEEIECKLKQGFNFISLGMDITMLSKSCKAFLSDARDAVAGIDRVCDQY